MKNQTAPNPNLCARRASAVQPLTSEFSFDESKIKNQKSKISSISVFCFLLSTFLLTGCQVLTYTSPTGERFTRSSLGATTSIASLSVESTTNGVRRVELRGYTNDSAQTLGIITRAAISAAIQSAK